MIRVWWARAANGHRRFHTELDPEERARAERFVHRTDRDRFTVSRVLAGRVLGLDLGVPTRDLRFARSCARCGAADHGKPHLVGAPRWEFSVSHAGDRVLVAVGRTGALGVDVEPVRQVGDISGLALHPAERVHGSHGLLRAWVRKEAALKATGDGLTVPLTALRMSGPDEPARIVEWPQRPELAARMRLADVDVGDGYVAAVACLGSLDSIRIRNADGLLAPSGSAGDGSAR